MGWFFLGAVQHGRNRIFNFLFHFYRVWRQNSQSSSKMMSSLLGFERFSHAARYYCCKTSNFKERFRPPLSSMLISTINFLFHFRLPPPPSTSMLDVLRAKRFEALVKINIDGGGGGEIVEKSPFLTRFSTGAIAPMF